MLFINELFSDPSCSRILNRKPPPFDLPQVLQSIHVGKYFINQSRLLVQVINSTGATPIIVIVVPFDLRHFSFVMYILSLMWDEIRWRNYFEPDIFGMVWRKILMNIVKAAFHVAWEKIIDPLTKARHSQYLRRSRLKKFSLTWSLLLQMQMDTVGF